MNQKNIFMFIGAILLLQGIAFYTMSDKVVTSSFPDLDEMGKHASITLMEVLAVLSILVAFISFAAKDSPAVLWGYTIGFGLFTLLTLKHLLIDQINVPIPALVIQIVITLLCAYLWMKSGKTVVV